MYHICYYFYLCILTYYAPDNKQMNSNVRNKTNYKYFSWNHV